MYPSHLLRRAALATALVGAAAGFAAAPANAASLEAAAKCKFPLIGTSPATLTVAGDLPTQADANVPTASVPLNVKLAVPNTQTTGQAISPGFKLEGEFNLTLAVKPPSGSATTVTVKATLDETTVPLSGVVGYVAFDLIGTGTFPSLTLAEAGETEIDVVSFNPNVTYAWNDEFGSGSVRTPPTGVDREPFIDSDADPATADIPCRFEPKVASLNLAKVNVEPLTCLPVINPPETPTAVELGFGDITSTTAHLRWNKPPVPPCGTETASFRIKGAGQTMTVPASQTDVVVDRLRPFTDYTFTVEALDQWGFASQPLTIAFKTRSVICTDDIKPPPTPIAVPLTEADITTSSVRLRWGPGTEGPCPREPESGYRITYGDKTVTVPASQTDVLISGLTPATDYVFEIRSFADDVFITTPPLIVNVKTAGGTGANIKFAYSLAGSTQLKTLTKGTLQLSGGIAADFVPLTGAFTADLTLNDTSGRLVAAGFLPVTAKIGFAPSGKTTGTLLDGVLKTNSKVRIKVKEVKLFGAIPLAGGNNCQTRSLSDINLQSTQAEFDPLLGGPIAGSYRISDLNGCGALNGLVSPLTAGGGNTVNLNLTPKPVAS